MISRCSSCGGFSLLEVLIATAVLTIGAGSLAQLFALSAYADRGSRNLTLSAVLAEQQLERLLATPFDDLPPSPPGAIAGDTPGYVDFLDATGGTAATPSSAVLTRRWSVEPLPASPDNALVLQVIVTAKRDRAAAQACLVGVKTRQAGS